ncbi:transmembrane protein 65 isoform X1 [Lacerta agilis]|uniref:transmembrane protein 65 isoform X1 n=1 Tax=Lacerta agilis TaxID=80427 RepID=UPI001419F83D|nr:transmembrane protein 65 isoform X1 [Lacerta agilis]
MPSTWLSCRLALRLGSGWPGGSSPSALVSRLSFRAPQLRGLRCCCCHCLLPLPGQRRCLSTFRRSGGGGGGISEEGLWLRLPPASAGSPRSLGTHPKKEPIEALNTAQGARDFIYSLHSTERSCLLRELHRFESIAIAQASRFPKPLVPLEMPLKQIVPPEPTSTWEKLEVAPPSTGQLKHVFFHNAIPFVGFGFFDNAIMIAAGTQIELSIGIVLGISTMAAAALGNLVSDLAGLGLAGYIEAMASRLGLSIPDLTPKQADMWQTRLSAHVGKAIGVTIGCLLGMFPLFFLGDEEEKKLEEKN